MQVLAWRAFSAFRQSVLLGDRRFIVEVQWNASRSYWTLDLRTAADDLIIAGLKLIPGVPILHKYQDDRLPDGQMVAVELSLPTGRIGLDDIPDSAVLAYFDPGEPWFDTVWTWWDILRGRLNAPLQIPPPPDPPFVWPLVANDLTTGAPDLGSPVLTQVHVLAADDLTMGAVDLGSPVLPDPAAMILEVNTLLESGTQVTIPLGGSGVNVNIDWGDGSDDDYTTSGNKTHSYGAEGTYFITITGTLARFGLSSPLDANYANVAKIVGCSQWGSLGLTLLVGAFKGAANLQYMPPNLPATATNLTGLLRLCPSFSGDLSGWDTSNITDMSYMLQGTTSFDGTGVANFDLSSLGGAGAMTFFAQSTSFSTPNYDALLIAWEAAKAGYPDDLSPSFGGSQYSAGAAATARAALITYGWTITDGGPA